MHKVDIPTDNESDMDSGGVKAIMSPSVTHPLVEDDGGRVGWGGGLRVPSELW